MMELGSYFVGKTKYSESKKFFTVEDVHGDVYIYERPFEATAKDIRTAITVAFIDDECHNLDGEYKVAGSYPNYEITDHSHAWWQCNAARCL